MQSLEQINYFILYFFKIPHSDGHFFKIPHRDRQLLYFCQDHFFPCERRWCSQLKKIALRKFLFRNAGATHNNPSEKVLSFACRNSIGTTHNNPSENALFHFACRNCIWHLPAPIYKLTSVFTQRNPISGWVAVLGWQTERDLALQTSKGPEEGVANVPVPIHNTRYKLQYRPVSNLKINQSADMML